MDFGSYLDDVVAVCTALVNGATPGERQGRPYEVPTAGDLAAEVRMALVHSDRRAAAPSSNLLPHFAELAAGARAVFEHSDAGRLDEAAEQVNALLSRYRPTPYLDKHGGDPWHLHFHGPAEADPTQWGGAITTALATVVGSDHADRLGVCAAPACDRVFVDVSRNGNRRFCSEACQNRVKAAAHRARQRG